MIPQGSATSLPHTSTPYYAQPGSSSYGYHNTTGLSEVAMGKLPAMGGSMHSLAGTASHRSGLSVQTHRSDMSDERQYQLSQESLEMAMEAAVLDDQVIDIILAKKPHIKKDELRRIRSNKSYHFILNTLNDYEKQTWTKSLIDLHIDYHAKQDEIKAYRDAYENARKSIKGAKSKNTGVTTKQFQHLIALANDWEEACER